MSSANNLHHSSMIMGSAHERHLLHLRPSPLGRDHVGRLLKHLHRGSLQGQPTAGAQVRSKRGRSRQGLGPHDRNPRQAPAPRWHDQDRQRHHPQSYPHRFRQGHAGGGTECVEETRTHLMAKPRKFYESLNAPSWSPHGKHRRPNPTAHRDPNQQPDPSAGGANQTIWTTITKATITKATISTGEIPKSPAIPFAGIRAGELIGHRAWRVIEENGRIYLASLAHLREWKP